MFSFITPAFAELKDADPIVFTGEDARILRNIEPLFNKLDQLYGPGSSGNERLAADFD